MIENKNRSKMFCKVIAEDVFQRKNRRPEQDNEWQNVASTLNPREDFGVIDRDVRDRLTHLIWNSRAETTLRKISGQVGELITEYHFLLEDILTRHGEQTKEGDCWWRQIESPQYSRYCHEQSQKIRQITEK